MAVLTNIPEQFLDARGIPVSGGRLHVYYSGGGTRRAQTWSDANEERLNTNPIILDARGTCKCFVRTDVVLNFILEDRDGRIVDSFYNIIAPGGGGGGGGGLDQVYHDETLSGNGTPSDPLSCLLKNADVSFVDDAVVVDMEGGSHAYTHAFVDDAVVVQEL